MSINGFHVQLSYYFIGFFFIEFDTFTLMPKASAPFNFFSFFICFKVTAQRHNLVINYPF